jgi:hypothetical protein
MRCERTIRELVITMKRHIRRACITQGNERLRLSASATAFKLDAACDTREQDRREPLAVHHTVHMYVEHGAQFTQRSKCICIPLRVPLCMFPLVVVTLGNRLHVGMPLFDAINPLLYSIPTNDALFTCNQQERWTEREEITEQRLSEHSLYVSTYPTTCDNSTARMKERGRMRLRKGDFSQSMQWHTRFRACLTQPIGISLITRHTDRHRTQRNPSARCFLTHCYGTTNLIRPTCAGHNAPLTIRKRPFMLRTKMPTLRNEPLDVALRARYM